MNSSAFYSSSDLGNLQPLSAAVRLAEPGLALANGPIAMPLPHLGFLGVSGADGLSFLHGQLTNDVQHQSVDTVALSAYCQAKGRMLASFVQWRDVIDGGPAVMLALSRELAAPIAKRLSMFVLRAKAKVVDRSEELVALGWIGSAGGFPPLGIDGLTLPGAAWGHTGAEGVHCLRLSDLDTATGALVRVVVIAPASSATAVWRALAAGSTPTEEAAWHLFEVHSGIARIVAPTQEQFVPQMLNYELVGGVNFKKGCYPGQEVVARSQYLGKLRRRMFLARAAGIEVKAGADVAAPGTAEPVGRVANAAPNPQGGTDLLIETTLAAAETDLSVDGVALQILALPYAIPAEQGAA